MNENQSDDQDEETVRSDIDYFPSVHLSPVLAEKVLEKRRLEVNRSCTDKGCLFFFLLFIVGWIALGVFGKQFGINILFTFSNLVNSYLLYQHECHIQSSG